MVRRAGNLSNFEDFDESSVRTRPNRRGSRPRTKERPSYTNAVTARVVGVDRGRWRTIADEGAENERPVTAMRARALARTPIVPGDLVRLTGDTSGRTDTIARIVEVEDRTSFLRRSADDDDASERPLVANADTLVMVTALAHPEPRGGMIDRCLVAAYVAGITPLLCLTKADLADPHGFLKKYAPLGVEHVTTHMNSDGTIAGIEALRERLSGHLSVLVGHSGVGKSTLINALVPGTERATGHVNAVTGRGRHTSSSALALRLPEGNGWVIDTPGVRSFGLGHVSPEELESAFEDLAPLMEECPRGCTHASADEGCALDALVADGHAGSAGPARLASFRRLNDTLRTNDPWAL
ncbi:MULTISPECIES: ribosome small subunit-dependent GTPase A [unclassified Dermabacter]|uniref:ribosome small subunit-dependent GTPase A n=1 Tax=unclassified Dermabacter TaxID=2635686 RepID=UPI000F89B341|nr:MULTISPECIES: ribosome small subunit-dependent GTPase A [unclassified Dermabacter]RUP87437.1 ribosome small subunit-dependent GTPase A [Dermabacter sp. HSID17554]